MSSRSRQGEVAENHSFSLFLARSHVIFDFKSLEDGCLTQNQLFSSGSFSFRMKGSQLDSSPVGMRSGLVKTPIKCDTKLLPN